MKINENGLISVLKRSICQWFFKSRRALPYYFVMELRHVGFIFLMKHSSTLDVISPRPYLGLQPAVMYATLSTTAPVYYMF